MGDIFFSNGGGGTVKTVEAMREKIETVETNVNNISDKAEELLSRVSDISADIEERIPHSANIELSNVTSSSTKVIDGQWTPKFLTLLSGEEVEDGTYSLSSYLPDDNYDYEVMFCYILQAIDPSTWQTFIRTDIMTNSINLSFISTTVSYAPNHSTGVIILPVGTGRRVRLNGRSRNTIWLHGYRRIGKNS